MNLSLDKTLDSLASTIHTKALDPDILYSFPSMGMLPGMPLFFSNTLFPPAIAISLIQQKLKDFQTRQEMISSDSTSPKASTSRSLETGLSKIASITPKSAVTSVFKNENDSFTKNESKASDEAIGIYAHILDEAPVKKLTYSPCSPTRNRYGRIYVSGRPLVMKDRLKIVELHQKGYKKINIAKELGVTHSCVSKVLRRYLETGSVEAKNVKETKKQRKKREFENDLITIEPVHEKKKMLSFTIEK
ncbi:unnamed protein product, partial [Mesorhabditis belari]|uniref:Paired domain-containing protein n=1 Tax=Mesorhabditis belari TaxID=2138241 RepID=A0AAF3FJR8_9BILA